MMRAETYDRNSPSSSSSSTTTRAEALDPAKLPTLANRIWTLLHEAELHRDLESRATQPELEDFGELIDEHVDGYLCEIEDLQVRDGLHILGAGAGRASSCAGCSGAILRLRGNSRRRPRRRWTPISGSRSSATRAGRRSSSRSLPDGTEVEATGPSAAGTAARRRGGAAEAARDRGRDPRARDGGLHWPSRGRRPLGSHPRSARRAADKAATCTASTRAPCPPTSRTETGAKLRR